MRERTIHFTHNDIVYDMLIPDLDLNQSDKTGQRKQYQSMIDQYLLKYDKEYGGLLSLETWLSRAACLILTYLDEYEDTLLELLQIEAKFEEETDKIDHKEALYKQFQSVRKNRNLGDVTLQEITKEAIVCAAK